MDHYLTTYRKDYLWPHLPGSGGGQSGDGHGVADSWVLCWTLSCIPPKWEPVQKHRRHATINLTPS
ncbi:hypothetical protein JYU34_010584 [Plutella xylostella]|uniref:Uncharacterized protein n=1 Tax=Plutella xylostella TaxID=51655 RepID=A0ABQ7QJY8_PLUXY|nr:hypothetical protein JYU34_010584 [Plutella xylostella]